MQLTATDEIAAPIDVVWRHVSDFERFEAALRQRGGKAERVTEGPVGPGTRWSGAMEVMGKIRAMDVTLTQMAVPTLLVAEGEAEGIGLGLTVALEALAQDRTRMTVTLDATARSFGAKLVLKPISLMQASLQEKFANRIAGYARMIEGSRVA